MIAWGTHASEGYCIVRDCSWALSTECLGKCRPLPGSDSESGSLVGNFRWPDLHSAMAPITYYMTQIDRTLLIPNCTCQCFYDKFWFEIKSCVSVRQHVTFSKYERFGRGSFLFSIIISNSRPTDATVPICSASAILKWPHPHRKIPSKLLSVCMTLSPFLTSFSFLHSYC